jgi:aldose sugar dehydrogenase
MTDQGLPGAQVNARWRSGFPTLATSGAAWVRGRQWGLYDGTLAVAALKGSRLLFMRFDAAGNLSQVRVPPALRRYGRLRSVTSLADGDLLVTTANGGSRDAVLRVHPGG